MGEAAAIEWISPSALARLQACGLAESRRRGQPAGGRPSNPITRLGNAAHRVLAWIARSATELQDADDAEGAIESRWTDEVAHEVEASLSNPSEPSYGPALRWPAYGRITAGLRVDGVALAQELAEVPSERRLPEASLASSDGSIRGTADLIMIDDGGGAAVIDHKVGVVVAEDVGQGGRYEQQVLLYAAIARDSGFAPTRAEIRPLGRNPLPVELTDARMDAVVLEAHAQLARYNDAVGQDQALKLATPSESSCGWCPYIVDCPAVWADPPPALGDLAIVEGDVHALQVLASSLALVLNSRDGHVTVTGLPTKDIRGRTPAQGDRLRITGLRRTSSGQMRSHPGRTLVSITSTSPAAPST